MHARGPGEVPGQEALDAAFRCWACTAEESIIRATDADTPASGNRGREPHLRWTSALPEDGRRRTLPSSNAKPWHWLLTNLGICNGLF
eukprot:4693139-Karenia_brevis.AAC.1